MSVRSIAAGVSLVFALCACTTTWSHFHADLRNSGFLAVTSPRELVVKWKTQTAQSVHSSPVLGPEGTLYVTTFHGEVYALNVSDGSVKWKWTGAQRESIVTISRTPAVDEDGHLYVIGQGAVFAGLPHIESRLIKLDKDTGSTVWSRRLSASGFCNSSPKVWKTGSAQSIFVQMHMLKGDQQLIVLDAGGNAVLTHPLGCEWPDDPWRNAKLVADGEVTTTDGPNGEPRHFWPYVYEAILTPPADPTPAILDAEDALVDGNPRVVVATPCGVQMLVWDPGATTLTELWRDTQPFHQYTSPAVAENGEVFIARDDDHLIGYDIDGNRLWSEDFVGNNDFEASPALYPLGKKAFFVYVPTRARMYKVNAGNGALFEELPVAYKTRSSPALTLNRVYVANETGMYSMNLQLGDVIEDPDPQHTVYLTSPAVGPDGSVYVVTENGWVIAYRNPNEL